MSIVAAGLTLSPPPIDSYSDEVGYSIGVSRTPEFE